ncbi:MAG: PKD domain-containing protein, partial [Actinomycetia bacterium]|nr:PKD domain-containing protein [Actinomycetes bacterium]
EEEENIEKEAPTITIEVYEGPIYSSSDNVCYYRIKAIVTGSPSPAVVFSKDDSGGAWGSKKVQVNLSDPTETYTLTATATNSEASATDSIALSWGCPIPNNPPEISEITIIPGNYAPGVEYPIPVVASDPDGDSLTYQWSVTGGSILDDTSNPMKWTTFAPGDYEVTVIVEDGKGGTDTKTETVSVGSLPITSLSKSEWGHIIKDDSICRNSTCKIMVGDYINNKPLRGFVSFDISGLAGRTVTFASLVFHDPIQWGDPASLVSLISIELVDWGNDALELEDYFLLSTTLGSIIGPDFMCGPLIMVDYLQDAIDSGKDRFQVRIHNTGLMTNNNNTMDAWGYPVDNIKLNVSSYIN